MDAQPSRRLSPLARWVWAAPAARASGASCCWSAWPWRDTVDVAGALLGWCRSSPGWCSPWRWCRRCAGARWRWDMRDEGDRHPPRHARRSAARSCPGCACSTWTRGAACSSRCSASRRWWCTPPPAGTRSRCCTPATPTQLRDRIAAPRAHRGRGWVSRAGCTARRSRVYSARGARATPRFPLLVIVGMSRARRRPRRRGDARAAPGLRRDRRARARRRRATCAGDRPRTGSTTTAIHHHTGMMRDAGHRRAARAAIAGARRPRRARCSGCSGCYAVDVQTGAGGKGGEISLPALTPDAVEELRAARPGGAARCGGAGRPHRRARPRASSPSPRSPPASSGSCCRCSRSPARWPSRSSTSERGEDAVQLLPHTGRRRLIAAAACCSSLAWLLSIARRDRRLRGLHDRPRRRPAADPARAAAAARGDACRSRRVRAVRGGRGRAAAAVRARVADGRGHGYAEEAVRRAHAVPARARARGARRSWTSCCPSWPTTSAALERPPARAPRGATCCRRCSPARWSRAAGVVRGRAVRAARAAARGALRLRALARRGLAPARRAARGALAAARARRPCSPRRALRESHTVAQNVFQRRARLADLERGVRQADDGADPAPGRRRGAAAWDAL